MNGDQTINKKPAVADIGRGAGWLIDGFGYFSKAPLAWIGAIIIYFIITLALSLVPIIGTVVAQVLMPVFLAGLIIGCHAQASGGEFTINHLFAGFSQHTGRLVAVGLLYTAGIIVITITIAIVVLILPGGLALAQEFEAGDVERLQQATRIVILIFLVASALFVPLLMAYWFAPTLVVLENMTPVQAMKTSFMGCLYNIMPFLLYGIVGLVLCFIAAIPFGLGFLILIPMVTASIYIAYREIFASG